jgi:two-component system chemotaxis response regulator CheY
MEQNAGEGEIMGRPDALKALVVDDNAYSRAICTALLKQLGASEVVQASGGAEAIMCLMEAQFTLVLMDWYMPDINGAGVMQVLRDRRLGERASTPVIVMTAYASKDNLQRARLLGVNDVISKPFSPEQLSRIVQRALRPAEPDYALI